MSKLYQDAILDAKALRASAIANAKSALEEAFGPKIEAIVRESLADKVEEAEEMEEGWADKDYGSVADMSADDYADFCRENPSHQGCMSEGKEAEEGEINEEELDEILNQLEEMSSKEEASLNEVEDIEEAEEEEEEKEDEEGEEDEKGEEAPEGDEAEGEEDEEPTDETKVIDITLGDLKQVIQSLMPAAEATPEEEEPTEDSEAEEEVSLEEILDELEKEGMEEPGHRDPGYGEGHNIPEEEGTIKEMDPSVALGIAGAGAAGVFGLSALIAKIQDYYKKNPKATGAAVMDALGKVGAGAAAGARNAPPTTGGPNEGKKHKEEKLKEDLGALVGPAIGAGAVVGLSTLIAMVQKYYKKNPTATGASVMNALEKIGGGAAAGARNAPPTTGGPGELEEAKATIKMLRKDLQEVNLLNAKYLYMNKLFKSKSLTESQKVKVINALDRATNVKEVKLTYQAISESFSKKKDLVRESVGFASKPAGMAPKANIVEADQFVSRWQKLAGIK